MPSLTVLGYPSAELKIAADLAFLKDRGLTEQEAVLVLNSRMASAVIQYLQEHPDTKFQVVSPAPAPPPLPDLSEYTIQMVQQKDLPRQKPWDIGRSKKDRFRSLTKTRKGWK